MRKFMVVMIVALSLLMSSAVSYAAAANPSVVIVNPNADSEIYSNNLLISVKITEPMTIRVEVYEQKQEINGVTTSIDVSNISADNNGLTSGAKTKDVPVLSSITYPCNNNLSFFTKQINEVTPGIYRIAVHTVDSSGAVLYTNNRRVIVKEKAENGDGKVFEEPQGTKQWIQNLFKSIFGS